MDPVDDKGAPPPLRIMPPVPEPAAASPAPAPASPEPPKADREREDLIREFIRAMRDNAGIQEQVLKEHTLALMENTKAVRALQLQIAGVEPTQEEPDGETGLMDLLEHLQESVDALDSRMIGMNLKLSLAEFVLEKVGDVMGGDEKAEPPRAGREFTMRDLADAKVEFEKRLEEEALSQPDEEQDDAAPPAPAPAEPAKPTMIRNATPPPPTFRKLPLPPLPVTAPPPKR